MRVLYRLQSQMPRTLSMPGFFAPASTTSRQFFWASKSHGLIIGLLVRSLTTILTFVISSQQLSPGLCWSGLYVQNNGFDFGPGPFSSQVHHPENQMIPGSSYMTINVWMWDETDWWVYVCSFCCIWWQTYRQLNNLLPIANTDTLVLLLISILFKTMCNHQYSFADTNTLLLLLLLISILFKTMRNHDKRNTGQPTGLLNLVRGISLGKIQSASLVQLNLSTLFLFDFFGDCSQTNDSSHPLGTMHYFSPIPELECARNKWLLMWHGKVVAHCCHFFWKAFRFRKHIWKRPLLPQIGRDIHSGLLLSELVARVDWLRLDSTVHIGHII